MRKIKVDIAELETAVESFIYASKEAGEVHYRLKQLGNALVDDIQLNVSAEYEAIMAAYSEAMNSVTKINEFFESLLLTIMKTPEMYSETEEKSIRKINAILTKFSKYQSGGADALEGIIQKAKENDDLGADALADLVNKSFQNTNMSNFAANENDANALNAAQASFGEAENTMQNNEVKHE